MAPERDRRLAVLLVVRNSAALKGVALLFLSYDICNMGGVTHMTTNAGVGMSHHHSPSIAGYEAAEKALENAVCASQILYSCLPRSGMSSVLCCRRCERPLEAHPSVDAGGRTIDGDDADESDFSVVVMAISSDELRWHNGLATGTWYRLPDCWAAGSPRPRFRTGCGCRGPVNLSGWTHGER